VATKRTSFGKRERRQSKTGDSGAEGGQTDEVRPAEGVSVGDQLQKIEAVHQRFEAGLISFEDFEAQKSELLSHLSVD
jgi:hypothetical protein